MCKQEVRLLSVDCIKMIPFDSSIGTQYFADYAEEIPGETTAMLSEAARSEGVYLIGGSIPERRGDKLYNTTTAFNPNGDMILK